MFTGNRYVTKDVAEKIPLEIQLYLWQMVNDLKQIQSLDYLQVFDLSTREQQGYQIQEIQHTQEQPRYKKAVTVRCTKPVCCRIFCIDDGEYSTMLFADEY